jgi:hypothetical protein
MGIDRGGSTSWMEPQVKRDYNVKDLLKIFTGVNVTNTAPTKEFCG